MAGSAVNIEDLLQKGSQPAALISVIGSYEDLILTSDAQFSTLLAGLRDQVSTKLQMIRDRERTELGL